MKVFYLGSSEEKEKIRERSKEDWSKVCWREVENGWFENKATKMLRNGYLESKWV